MTPLKALVFPQYNSGQTAQSATGGGPARSHHAADSGIDNVAPTTAIPAEDRRHQTDRRQSERRLKQQSIMLDTRKAQGRRRSHGRRASDQATEHEQRLPISIIG